MKERICSEVLENSEIDPVDRTIYAAHQEADQRGLSLWMIRNSLAHVNTTVLEKEGDTARVRLEAERKNSLRKFFSGETHHVEKIVTLHREEGKWKICGDFFNL